MVEMEWFSELVLVFPGLNILGSLLVRYVATPMFILVVGLVYYFVPNAKVRFRDVWMGAVITGLLWTVALKGFSWVIRDMGRFTQVNGSIAAVVVFLIWVYIQAVIMLYGVEFTATYARLRGDR
jgi:membrane protein